MKPFSGELPNTADTAAKVIIISAKVSTGPSCSAKPAMTGASSVSSTVAMEPATKEPIAAVDSAGPARPALAILLPSSADTMEPASPGVFSRMEVVEPPNMAP